jgi:hypothetical protein
MALSCCQNRPGKLVDRELGKQQAQRRESKRRFHLETCCKNLFCGIFS